MNSRAPSPLHKAFRQASLDLLREHAGALPADEMLAVAAQMVGQIMAMQDQRTMTEKMAMEIVWRNIEAGNASVIDGLRYSTGGTA